MKRITQKEKVKSELEILLCLNGNNIQATVTKNGSSGYARYYEKGNKPEIRIPSVRNYENVGMTFHEIGHIVLGHCEMVNNKLTDKRPSYIHEYEAEQFAINKLKELNLNYKQYELNAIRYQLENIAQAYNRKHPLKKVPREIIEWTGLKVRKWNKAAKVFVHRDRVKTRKQLENLIQYK